MLGVLFDGIAYGSLLFLVSLGLSVTMGLMNFVNLAHGAFAMAGGFVCVVAMTRFGVPFLAALPLAFLITALVGAVLERLLYRRLYGANDLDQVLFSIGLDVHVDRGGHVFLRLVAAAGAATGFPARAGALRGRDFGIYRLFLVGAVAALTTVLGLLLARTRFGAQVRASVDDAQAARGLGIDVDRVFSIAFALGSGLAGLGGALGIEVLGLDSGFPLKFMVYFLLVVVVGGAGTIVGPLVAALVLGVSTWRASTTCRNSAPS